ncbi:hypothetical protein [Desulfobacter curvatus]|uniref:hypothetical protein n=1 Tax=Desulfobacter curvatus TaxID=2290 RepID=UPI00037B0F02|nr:hypothetical protein [Desulfobacter curvatus]
MNVPVVAHPLGWVVLGAAGYLTYKAGKKAGKNTEEDIAKTSLSDRVIKGAMKAVYKTQKGVSQGLGKAKEKYGTLWEEARTEANTVSN